MRLLRPLLVALGLVLWLALCWWVVAYPAARLGEMPQAWAGVMMLVLNIPVSVGVGIYFAGLAYKEWP